MSEQIIKQFVNTQNTKMGSCVSSYRLIKKNKKEKSYQFSPSDINEYDPVSTENFQFQGVLSNIKIENINSKLQKESFSIRFVLHDIFQLICPLVQVNNNKIKWDCSSKFLFSLNAYQLRARFLKIQIMDLNKKVVMSISINLYRIATGPYHHDFSLSKDNKSHGRLIFDFRLTQFAKIKLQCLSNEVIFFKDYLGERYNFILEFYKVQHRSSQKNISRNKKTQPSYIFQVPLVGKQKYRSLQKADKEPSPTLRQKRTASKLIKQGVDVVILWNQQINKQMPVLDIKVKISQLMSATIGVKIYRNPTNKITRQFGRSTIILSQIFTNNLSRISKKSKQNYIKKIQQISKNIWSKGIKIGECKLTFQITTFKILKQTHGKTQTQDGIVDMNEFQYYKVQKNKFVQQFFNNLQDIQKQIIQLNQVKAKKEQNNKQAPQSAQQMKKCMQKLKSMLMGTGRSSSSYLSQNTHKLQKQMILVSILKMMCVIISQQNAQISKICWENVIYILHRGQIKLKNWQFSEQQRNQIKKNQVNGQLRKKIDGGVEFCAIIYQLLKKAIDTSYLALDEQNKHSQIYKSFCYFKVPIFRQKIIQSLQSSSIKQKINDNHMQQFVQNTKPYENKGSYSSFFTIVDDDNNLYQMISNTEKGQEINKDLANFLDQHDFLDDIALRGDIFYDNMRYVMQKFISVKELTNSYNYFPGYTIMASSFIQGMKETELTDYSSSLILCLTTAVQNQNLLYSILKILFRKTNLYSTADLTKLITILCYFMHNVPKPCLKKLSPFPYKYFIQNLKQILETQLTMNVGQTLILLYNNYQNFHMLFRYELSMYLLGKMLWRFIYHWSFNIRRVIDHMIILKIAQDTELLTNTNIEQRLRQFYRILVNGEQLWNNYKVKKIKRIQNKEDSLYMKMKNKLRNNPNRNVHCYKEDQFRFQEILTDLQLQKSNIIVKNYNADKKNTQQLTDSQQRRNMKTSHQPSQPQQIRYDFTETSQFSSPSPSKISHVNSKISIISPIDSMIQSHKISLFYKKNHSMKISSKSSSQAKFFKPQQLIISEQIPSSTYSYFQIAAKQFREILKLVYEFYDKNQKLPTVNLGLMIEVDRKEMMPYQSDFSLLF